MNIKNKTEKRELRAVNRKFSLGEYGQRWTKLERYLFIEIYNVIKEFYTAVSSENIKTFSGESILLTLPVDKLDKKLFKPSQKNRDLMNAAEGLSKKQISLKSLTKGGSWAFKFISIFPEIAYDPTIDKRTMGVRIPSSVYEEMMPIESYCLLDVKMISEFRSGNTIRLYEIFKSHAFRKKITLTIDTLRKQLGFFKEGVYEEWKHFNAKVLKKAVKDINTHKQYDIEVIYKKERGSEEIEFTILTHKEHKPSHIPILDLNEFIIDRTPSLIQSKYIETTLMYCNKSAKNPLNVKELTEWVISDLVSSQASKKEGFDFKHSMNAISQQIRHNVFTRPFSHKHLAAKEDVVFNEVIYEEMKTLIKKGEIPKLLANYSREEMVANQFDYLLD
jgi:hypothetical protein